MQALGHVGGHFLQHVLGQVETLQLGQRAEGLGVDDGDLVVHQDQGLGGRMSHAMRDCTSQYYFLSFLLHGVTPLGSKNSPAFVI